MVTLCTAIFAVVALVSSASAQSNSGRGPSQSVGNRGGSRCGNCFAFGVCPNQFQPLCGIDGTTYSNRCVFNCALKCSPGLRIKYEGVCPKSRRPYPQTTTSKRGIYPVTSTSRPYYPPVRPSRDNYLQAESQARPKTIPTTSRPGWQQSYGGNSGYGNNGRRSRDAEDDDDFYGSEDDNDV